MSKLAHSNDATVEIIERDARDREERGLRDEPDCGPGQGRPGKNARCPTCGEPVETIFDHVDIECEAK